MTIQIYPNKAITSVCKATKDGRADDAKRGSNRFSAVKDLLKLLNKQRRWGVEDSRSREANSSDSALSCVNHAFDKTITIEHTCQVGRGSEAHDLGNTNACSRLVYRDGNPVHTE